LRLRALRRGRWDGDRKLGLGTFGRSRKREGCYGDGERCCYSGTRPLERTRELKGI
jgi:hypothetical protein